MRGHSEAKVAADGRSRYLDNLYDEYGLTVLRYGWIDVDRRACLVAAQVATVLRRLGWPGSARYCGATCEARKQATN